MSKKRKTMYRVYVSHPRYGDKPRFTNASFTREQLVSANWQYTESEIILGTAIEADVSKQNYSIYPIKVYADLERQCISCRRWFLFFAEEQKFWFEVLGFYVDADCVKCIDCRKKDQSIKQFMKDYSVLVKIKSRTEDEAKKLKKIALELFQLGYIKDKSKIDRISGS